LRRGSRQGDEEEGVRGKWVVVVVALVVGVFAALVGLVWTPDRSVDSLKRRWATSPSKFVIIDGVSLHLRDEGPAADAHPIVLIHGTSSSLHTWAGWMSRLKWQHRVVSFDLPGAGLSAQFQDDDYRIEHYTHVVEHLLEQLEARHAILVGNSLGGRIAWEIALERPDLATRLVLIDSVGYPGEAGPPPLAVQIARVPVAGPFIIEHFTPRGLVEKSLRVAFGDPRKLTRDLVDRYYELLLRAGNRRALMLQLQQESYEDSARIRSITIPTLILWGALDHVVPIAHAQRFHDDIAGSQLVVFATLGHVPQEEGPDQTLQALEDFLPRHDDTSMQRPTQDK
jgi:pimeloyl-ACP methyl ester carboxylesterase